MCRRRHGSVVLRGTPARRPCRDSGLVALHVISQAFESERVRLMAVLAVCRVWLLDRESLRGATATLDTSDTPLMAYLVASSVRDAAWTQSTYDPSTLNDARVSACLSLFVRHGRLVSPRMFTRSPALCAHRVVCSVAWQIC